MFIARAKVVEEAGSGDSRDARIRGKYGLRIGQIHQVCNIADYGEGAIIWMEIDAGSLLV